MIALVWANVSVFLLATAPAIYMNGAGILTNTMNPAISGCKLVDKSDNKLRYGPSQNVTQQVNKNSDNIVFVIGIAVFITFIR